MTKTEQFTQKLKEIYGSDFATILKTHESKKPFTFFINTNSHNANEVLNELKKEGFEVTKANFPNSYISTSEKKIIRIKSFFRKQDLHSAT